MTASASKRSPARITTKTLPRRRRKRVLDKQTKEKFMKKTVGLWIDHRKAVIVFVEGKEEEIKLICSKEEKQL